jgi:hypothetical protein
MLYFYDVKPLTVISYIFLIIASIISYFSGTIFPVGLGIVIALFFIVLGISVFYIVLSIKNKRFHPLVFFSTCCWIIFYYWDKTNRRTW